MLESLVSYALAAAIVVGFLVWRERHKQKAAVEKTAGALESLGGALQRLTGSIETFARKTVHPRELLDCPEFHEAVTLLKQDDVSIDTVRQYAMTGNVYLASAAFEALTTRSERQSLFNAIMMHFRSLDPDVLHYALRFFTSLDARPPVGGPVALAESWWSSRVTLVDSFRDYFSAREKLGDAAEFGTYLDWSAASKPAIIDAFLSYIDHPYARTLRDQLTQWRGSRVDSSFLNSFGRFWVQTSEEALVTPEPWKELLDRAEQSVLAFPPHSVLVTGGPRTGKTSFLRILGERLMADGWRVFEANAADVMAGQIYFGELEGRIRNLVTELDAGKRVAWYAGNILQLAESGTHRGQSASVLDQILPAVIAGRLVIFAEESPEAVSRLFQSRPSLRTQMEVYRLDPFSTEEFGDFLERAARQIEFIRDKMIGEDAITACLQLSQQYLGGAHLAGIGVDLLKRSVQNAAEEYLVTADHVLMAVSQISGMPQAILDDKQKIDLASVRHFFNSRLIGQDEAVSAVVDRIAMLKGGLVDPHRPVGVFLFAGPTGTGKTELAKTLAEYLFSSPERMTRLDMSEFQTPDSTVKIVGERGYSATDSLAARIRKQPFSVVLLDEFEKAHANIWDLFLQVFDDGRLSDANGYAVDFRHTIIVLTSNLGATSHQSADVGFVHQKGAYGEEQVLRSISRTFRPEFINRLDKIVVFKPLSREVIREILHKELRQILDRRGLRNRDWAVEWESTAIEFLLDRGFSPEMGARPLKRAIDQHLLAPLAATLVEHRFPEGDQFLFVRSNGKAIEVEFVDPDAPMQASGDADGAEQNAPLGDPVSLPSMILQPGGGAHERAALEASFEALETTLASPDWITLKDGLLEQASAADIWSRPDRHALFARIAVMDSVEEAARTADRLHRRLTSRGTQPSRASRELVGRLALQLHVIGEGITDVRTEAPADAVIAVEPVFDAGGEAGPSEEWCGRLARMYRQWAERRRMQFEDMTPPSKDKDALLHVNGFGAFRTLENEAGLHVLEDAVTGQRSVARVRVAPGPQEEPRGHEAYRTYSALLALAGEPTSIVRRYRENPAPLVRDARGGWRTGRFEDVLSGDFDLFGHVRVSSTD